MLALPAIFCLLVSAAGWFYLFYSTSAQRLGIIEAQPRNQLRIRLRRAGGVVMLALATSFYAMFVALDRQNGREAGRYLIAVFVLLIIILILGLADLRLTRSLREDRRKRR